MRLLQLADANERKTMDAFEAIAKSLGHYSKTAGFIIINKDAPEGRQEVSVGITVADDGRITLQVMDENDTIFDGELAS
jgi:hypothetical protein